MNKIKAYGLSYIENGFSVIPVGRNKRPLIDWKQNQNVRASREQFLEWIIKFPEMQLGIVTGQISNLVVVDIDNYKDGFKLDFELPKTRMVKTGSGGTHYYYRHPKVEVSNAADAEKKWDIRGDGGYVIAPPSFNEKGEYIFLNKEELAELPKEIIELSKTKHKLKTEPIIQRDFGGSIFQQLGSFDCKRGLEMLSGSRHLRGETYSFRNRSGGGYHIDINGEPANCWITPDGYIGSGSKGVNGKGAGPTLTQWLDWFGHDKQTKAAIIKEVFGFKDKPIVFEKSKSKNSYTWGLDCIDEQISTLKKKTLTILLAEENAGKSTFSLFFARENAKRYGHKVVLYSLESTKQELFQSVAFSYADISRIDERDETYLENPKYQEKIKELENQKDITIIGRTASSTMDMEEIESVLAQQGEVDLLIIDNLTCINKSSKEYNENIAVEKIIKQLIGLSEKLDCPIVLVHHYNKRPKGTSALFRSVSEASGSGAIKNLAHKIIQVARNRITDRDEKITEEEQAEFYIREGKVRNRAGDNELTVYYKNGTFSQRFREEEEITDVDFFDSI